MSASKVAVPTPDEIRRWPATVKAVQAGAAFDLGEDTTYKLIQAGQFPVPVLKLGRTLRVTRAAVMAALGIPEVITSAPGIALATGIPPQVGASASHERSEAHLTSRAA